MNSDEQWYLLSPDEGTIASGGHQPIHVPGFRSTQLATFSELANMRAHIKVVNSIELELKYPAYFCDVILDRSLGGILFSRETWGSFSAKFQKLLSPVFQVDLFRQNQAGERSGNPKTYFWIEVKEGNSDQYPYDFSLSRFDQMDTEDLRWVRQLAAERNQTRLSKAELQAEDVSYTKQQLVFNCAEEFKKYRKSLLLDFQSLIPNPLVVRSSNSAEVLLVENEVWASGLFKNVVATQNSYGIVFHPSIGKISFTLEGKL
ncbi:hypothetical protein [Aliiroseovarius crassostreae]|uniref:hypothetical protein n=1 Tax=Aliiroseovarius crassostreae TaxID=154981 RepID=UPI00220A020F|nr:hypothetical protein [Aliiroseovarius crassostreae]UWP90854.1 hypothetical protein K3J57_15220 [Aliiroseovarius crassostreae]UWQ03517.1 hypothetical protein K3X44_15470 [Aliiroseovarius crassostreae]